MRVRANFTLDKRNLNAFKASCEAAIRNVGRGTKKATIAAAEEILEASKKQVPKMTLTLESSAYYKVYRRKDTSPTYWAYEAELGYGGNGDPVNPQTGRRASAYMLAVHEDLEAWHFVGKAKFLEDPVHDYAANNFKRVVFKYAQESLASMSD